MFIYRLPTSINIDTSCHLSEGIINYQLSIKMQDFGISYYYYDTVVNTGQLLIISPESLNCYIAIYIDLPHTTY